MLDAGAFLLLVDSIFYDLSVGHLKCVILDSVFYAKRRILELLHHWMLCTWKKLT